MVVLRSGEDVVSPPPPPAPPLPRASTSTSSPDVTDDAFRAWW
jgi:hypothetical protein